MGYFWNKRMNLPIQFAGDIVDFWIWLMIVGHETGLFTQHWLI